MVDASVVIGSFCAIKFHCTEVVITEIAIVNHSVVCLHCALQGRLLLLGRLLQALSPCVPCRFVREGVDGTQYLAIAPRHFTASLFGLIVVKVVFPVTSAGALNARVLCQSRLVVGSAIMIMLDATVLLIAIVVRVVLCIA
jgi:hypothetical protein